MTGTAGDDVVARRARRQRAARAARVRRRATATAPARRPPGEAPRSPRRQPPATATASTAQGVITDASLHRRQHPVPGADAVRARSSGLRAERRRDRGSHAAPTSRLPGPRPQLRPRRRPGRRAGVETEETDAISATPRRARRRSRSSRRRHSGEAAAPARRLDAVPAAAARPALARRLLRRSDDLPGCPSRCRRGRSRRATRSPGTFSTYTDAISRVLPAVRALVHLRGHRDGRCACSSPIRSPTRSPSSPGAGRTCCW